MGDRDQDACVNTFMDWMGYSIQYAIEMYNHKNDIEMPLAELDQKVGEIGLDIISNALGNRSRGIADPADWDLLYESTMRWCNKYAGLMVEY